MKLFPSFVRLVPLILLKLLAKGSFGSPEQDAGRDERALAGDVTLVPAVGQTVTRRVGDDSWLTAHGFDVGLVDDCGPEGCRGGDWVLPLTDKRTSSADA